MMTLLNKRSWSFREYFIGFVSAFSFLGNVWVLSLMWKWNYTLLSPPCLDGCKPLEIILEQFRSGFDFSYWLRVVKSDAFLNNVNWIFCSYPTLVFSCGNFPLVFRDSGAVSGKMNLPPFSFLAMNTEGWRGKFEPVSERIGDIYTLSLIERTEEEVDKKSSLQLTIPWRRR